MIDTENDLSFQHAEKVLTDRGYTYEVKAGASMMWVQSKTGKVYAFYPTTCRWAPRYLKGKHYRAKSVEDFLERFVEPTDEQENKIVDRVEESTGVKKDNGSLYDLIHYLWDEFESGKSVGQVVKETHYLFREAVRDEATKQRHT